MDSRETEVALGSAEQYERMARLIRFLREEAGLSLQYVADRLGLTGEQLRQYESAEGCMDFTEIHAYCEVVGISMEEFLVRYEAGDSG